MATKYWVGGNGNWSSATNWRTTSGGLVVTTAPGSTDAAVLDANSGASTITVDSNITIQTLTCTGFTGTLAFGIYTISLNTTGTVFTGATTMSVSYTNEPLIIVTNASASTTITPTAVTEVNSISFRIAAGAGALTITTGGSVRTLDFTDGTNATGYSGAIANSTLTIYGGFIASTSGMTRTAGGGVYTFASTSGTIYTITPASVTFDNPWTFNGAGGSWRLLGALTLGSSRNCTLTAGSLDLNSNTLTAGTFTSTGSGVRYITFGGGNISVNGTNQTVVNITYSSDFTVNGPSNIRLIGNPSTGTRQITGPQSYFGIEQNVLSVYITGGTDTFTFGTNRVWKDIDFTGFKGSITSTTTSFICYGNFTLDSGMTSVAAGTGNWRFAASGAAKTIDMGSLTTDVPISFINGTLQPFLNGIWSMASALLLPNSALTITTTTLPDNLNTQTLKLKAGTTNTVGSFVTTGQGQKYLQSTTAGTQATISDASGTNSVTYLTIQDSVATGGATWNAYDSTNVNAGNNTGWFLPPTPAVSNEITMRLRSFTQPRRF